MAWDTVDQQEGTQQQQQQQTGTQQAAASTSAQNQYGAGQQALQGQVGGLYGQLVQGNIPQTFTAPQSVIDNYMNQFDTWTANEIALRGGSGGPQLAANRALGLSDLMSRLYQSGVSNYGNALAGAGNFSLNPTGHTGMSNTSSNTTGAETINRQFDQSEQKRYDALQAIIDNLGGFLRRPQST